jgi:ankyrin repeat protein
MSALLRSMQSKSMAGAGSEPASAPLRSRNESIPDHVDPVSQNLTNALFNNALKALSQNQAALLDMFLNKHPSLALLRNGVERPARVGVDPSTGKEVRMAEATTVSMLLFECAVELGAKNMASSVLKKMAEEGARVAKESGKDWSILDELTTNYEGSKTALHMIARNDMLELLQEIMEAADVQHKASRALASKLAESTNSDKEEPPKPPPLERLPVLADKDDATLLIAACATGALRVIEYLLSLKSDVNAAQSAGATPLHLAASAAGPKTIGMLVQAGAKLNTLDKAQFTPFFLACKTGNVEACKALHEAGADVSMPTENGAEPIYVAAQLGRVAVLKKLVEWGVDVDTNGSGHRPLHIAVMMGHTAAVDVLLDAGASLDVEGGEQKSTPIGIACQHGYDDVVELLIAKGADVNKSCVGSVTPLHLACWFGKRVAVEKLIAAGANLDALDDQGKKPVDFAGDGFKHGIADAKKVEKIVRKAMGEEVDGKKKKKKNKSGTSSPAVNVLVPQVQAQAQAPAPVKKSNLSRME